MIDIYFILLFIFFKTKTMNGKSLVLVPLFLILLAVLVASIIHNNKLSDIVTLTIKRRIVNTYGFVMMFSYVILYVLTMDAKMDTIDSLILFALYMIVKFLRFYGDSSSTGKKITHKENSQFYPESRGLIKAKTRGFITGLLLIRNSNMIVDCAIYILILGFLVISEADFRAYCGRKKSALLFVLYCLSFSVYLIAVQWIGYSPDYLNLIFCVISSLMYYTSVNQSERIRKSTHIDD